MNEASSIFGRLVRSPIVWASVLAVVITAAQLPYSHLIEDDYIHVAILEGRLDDYGRAPFRLYSFLEGDPEQMRRAIERGPVPWLAHPETEVDFFRPLSSALLALDHAIVGRMAWGYKLQSIAWYLAIVITLGYLLLRSKHGDIRTSRLLVTLAPIVLALSPAHWQNVMYNASRWVLVATALGSIGLLAHIRWREEGWRPGRGVSVGAFALSLLAGEAGVAFLAYLAAYELVAAPGGRTERVRALAPTTVVLLAYFVAYRAMGFGAHGGDGYLDPLGRPVAFLRDLPTRLLAMLGELLAGVPGWLWTDGSRRVYTTLAGAGAVVMMTVLLVPAWRRASRETRRLIGWLILGAVGSLLPLAASPPGSRHLIVPFFGLSALIAFVIVHWWTVLRRGLTPATALAAIACVAVVFVHLVAAPYRWFSQSVAFDRGATWLERTVDETEFVRGEATGQTTIFLTTYLNVAFSGYFLRTLNGQPLPERWWILSAAPFAHRYLRTAPETLELEFPEGQMLGTFQERSIRSATAPLSAGDRIGLSGMEVTILEVNEIGPTRIRFTFDRPLEDSSLRFMAVVQGELRPIQPPLPGQAIDLPG
jgi:hypothetical protein